MTGTSVAGIVIVCVVIVVGLAVWLGMVFWAGRHPGWKRGPRDVRPGDVRGGAFKAEGGRSVSPRRDAPVEPTDSLDQNH
jgi:hypothetical protein